MEFSAYPIRKKERELTGVHKDATLIGRMLSAWSSPLPTFHFQVLSESTSHPLFAIGSLYELDLQIRAGSSLFRIEFEYRPST